MQFWELDTDSDGNVFGVEHALGTNPLVADRGAAGNLVAPSINGSGQAVLSFGYNASATPGTVWVLLRGTLTSGFSEVYRYDGTVETFNAGLFSSSIGGSSITVTDLSPPAGRAFYRFQAIAP